MEQHEIHLSHQTKICNSKYFSGHGKNPLKDDEGWLGLTQHYMSGLREQNYNVIYLGGYFPFNERNNIVLNFYLRLGHKPGIEVFSPHPYPITSKEYGKYRPTAIKIVGNT